MCHKKLTERASCEAVQRYCPPKPVREFKNPLCELGEWSEWSSCSVTCGKGVQTRDRRFKNRLAAKSCSVRSVDPPIVQQTMECWTSKECLDPEEEEEEVSDYKLVFKPLHNFLWFALDLLLLRFYNHSNNLKYMLKDDVSKVARKDDCSQDDYPWRNKILEESRNVNQFFCVVAPYPF